MTKAGPPDALSTAAISRDGLAAEILRTCHQRLSREGSRPTSGASTAARHRSLVHQSISRTPFVRALPLISVELMQHPGLAQQYRARIIDPVRNHAIHRVRAGIEQGIFRPDIDPSLVVDAVISPVIYRRVILHEDLSL